MPRRTPLHPTLAKDTLPVVQLQVCTVLLMNDSQYPWVILVPDRPDLRDLDQLEETDAQQVAAEIRQVSQHLRQLFQPTKLNVASLGNMVPQLHIHVVARYEDDKAWPRPVWGAFPPVPYTPEALEALLPRLRAGLQ